MPTLVGWIVLFAALFLIPRISYINSSFTKELLANLAELNEDNKTIALVTAHPDDESMFFTPFLELLRNTPSIAERNVKVELLSLTTGAFL